MKKIIEKENLLTTAQLADRWGLHPQTLSNWRAEKRGPKYIKIGDLKRSPVYYRMQDILEYEEQILVNTDT